MIGNALLIFILYGLFALKQLDRITLSNFYALLIPTVIGALFIIIKKNKIFNKNTLLNIVFLVVILGFFYPLIKDSLYSFIISWDALGIWFFKAKVLFFSSNIDSYFKEQNYLYTSQAYPLGLSILISACYRLYGFVNDQVVQLYLLAYFINMVFLFFGIIRMFFNKIIHNFMSLIICLSLLISGSFVIYSHNGYVDLPLSFIFAVIFVMVYLFLSENEKDIKFQLLLSVVISGGIDLTIKNEAITYVLAVYLVTAAFSLKDKIVNGWKNLFILILVLSASLFPFIYWQIYKSSHHINFYLDGNFLPTIESLKRTKMIFNYYFLEVFNTNRYNLTIIPMLFLFLLELSYFLFKKRYFNKSFILLGIFLFQVGVYTYVYMITTMPFITQIESSLERLVLQLLPCFYLLVIVLLKEILNYK
jgi:MFS family permease